MRGHAAIYRATDGLIGHRFPGAPPTLLLDHTGAKSGAQRTSPLRVRPDGHELDPRRLQGRLSQEPGAGFTTCVANPDTTVQVGSQHRRVHARVADAAASASACGR